jgi:F-type H+-transporting ATPase subunit delta
VARRELVRGYGEALLAVAQAEGVLEDVEDELFRFARTLEQHHDLREALTDPNLPVDRKKAIIDELLGDRPSPHAGNLLGFLVEQGRARDLGAIVDELVALAAERRRAAVAQVRTAIPLTRDQRNRLTEALERATSKVIELKVVVDPSVIGGVVARVGDQVIDGSIRRRLELARERLSEV